MLTFRKYIDIKNNGRIISSGYAKSLKYEYIALALSDGTLMLHAKSLSNEESTTKILPWFKYEKICTIKFSNYGSLLNILSTEGLILRIPICVLFVPETSVSWERLVSVSDPCSYVSELKSDKQTEIKKKPLDKLGDLIKGYVTETSVQNIRPSIYLEKNSSFQDIELIKLKYSNLKDPNDLSYVINVNKLENNSDNKDILNFYSYFSDFEIWITFEKKEIVIVSSMRGAIFFVYETKQVLVYCFDFGIVSLNLIKQDDKTSLLFENDLGDHLILLLEKKGGDSVTSIIEEYGSRNFQINYTSFRGGAALLFQPSIENHSLKVYEHSNSVNELRVFNPDLQMKEEYKITISNIHYVIDWDIFFLIIHGYGSKVYFSLLLKQMIKIQNYGTGRCKEDALKSSVSQSLWKNSRYFCKPLQNQFQIILQDCLEIDGDVRDVRQLKGSETQNDTRDIFLFICSSNSCYYANTNLEAILAQLEQKFILGDVIKNDYILFDNLSKVHSDNFVVRHSELKEKLSETGLFGVLFDIEIFEKIKHQEEIMHVFDFKDTIQAFIEHDSISSRKSILHLISEKILLDKKISISTIAYYTVVIFYCCWKTLFRKENFELFTTPKNLEALEQIYKGFEVPNILPQSKLIHIILYLSYNFRLKLQNKKSLKLSPLFEAILRESANDNDLKAVLNGEVNKVYTDWLLREYKNFSAVLALPIDIMQEKHTKENWTLICSLLSSRTEEELSDILKLLMIDFRTTEVEELTFNLSNFSENWTLSLVSIPDNKDFGMLLHHLMSTLSLKQEFSPFEPKVNIVKSLEDFFSSKIILTSYGLIFIHISYVCLILMLLKNKSSRAEEWKKIFAECVHVLKQNKFIIDENLIYACVTLNDVDSFNLLKA